MSPAPSPLPPRALRLLVLGAGVAGTLALTTGPARADVFGHDLSAVEPATQQAAVGVPFAVTVRGQATAPTTGTSSIVVVANPVDVPCAGYARHNASFVGGGGDDFVTADALRAGASIPVTVTAPGEIRLCAYAGPGGYSTMATSSPIQPTLRVVPASSPDPPAEPKPRGSCTVTPRRVRQGRIVVRCTGVSGRVDVRVRRDGRTRHVWRTLQAGRLRASPAELGLRRGVSRISVFQDGVRLGWAPVRRR